MKLGRRGFLKAVAAAPVAAPVVAKEAAAKMGMGGGAGLIGGANYAMPPSAYPMAVPEDRGSYLNRMLKELDSGDRDHDIANDAKYAGRTLDCDLASLRSVSVSFAYQTQRARHVVEIKRQRRESILRELEAIGKRSMFG